MQKVNTMNTNALITDFLKKLGFTYEESKLYIALVKNGPSTLLAAAKLSGIERTKLYRMLDHLLERKLIEEVPQHRRRIIKAADLHTLQLLVKEKDITAQYLTNTFPAASQALQEMTNTVSGNNVIYYHGIEGIRQMVWNMLRCKGLFRTYSYRFWDDILGHRFVLQLNKELLAQDFQVHDLYSDQYIDFKKQWLQEKGQKPAGRWPFWDSRHISEKTITINQNIDIYNDVVSYYYWQGDETFGVEIYNERVADLQKQIHDVLWRRAKKKPELDWTKEWK